MRNITITVPEDLARWARRQAAEKDVSVSKLVSRMLEEERRRTDGYWQAYREWKRITRPVKGFAASKRLSRDAAHEPR